MSAGLAAPRCLEFFLGQHTGQTMASCVPVRVRATCVLGYRKNLGTGTATMEFVNDFALPILTLLNIFR
jgi:hypothetical protein